MHGRTGLLLAGLVAATVLVGCGAQNTLDNSQDVTAAITRQLPGVTNLDLAPQGDGFTTPYSLFAYADSTATNTGALRAQALQIARILWNTADANWDQLVITLGCPARPPGDAAWPPNLPCSEVALTLTPSSASRLWGASAIGHGPSGQASGQLPDPDTKFDYTVERPQPYPAGWQLFGPHAVAGSTDAVWDVAIPAGVSDADRTAGMRTVLCLAWTSFPDRVTGILVQGYPLRTTASSAGPAPIQWTATGNLAQLRQECGPRAAGLPS